MLAEATAQKDTGLAETSLSAATGRCIAETVVSPSTAVTRSWPVDAAFHTEFAVRQTLALGKGPERRATDVGEHETPDAVPVSLRRDGEDRGMAAHAASEPDREAPSGALCEKQIGPGCPPGEPDELRRPDDRAARDRDQVSDRRVAGVEHPAGLNAQIATGVRTEHRLKTVPPSESPDRSDQLRSGVGDKPRIETAVGGRAGAAVEHHPRPSMLYEETGGRIAWRRHGADPEQCHAHPPAHDTALCAVPSMARSRRCRRRPGPAALVSPSSSAIRSILTT
jgi:hypothetical protein